jgi:hypothetical protein
VRSARWVSPSSHNQPAIPPTSRDRRSNRNTDRVIGLSPDAHTCRSALARSHRIGLLV